MDKKIEYFLEEENEGDSINNNQSVSSFNDSISEENDNNIIKKDNEDIIIKRVTGFQNSSLTLEVENEQNNKLEEFNNNDEIKEIDILDKSYEIPLNMFRYPNNSKEIIFEDDEKNSKIILLNSKKFCIRKSPIIETFLVNLFIFSEFVDPFSIEKNNQINVIFVKKNNKENKYIIDLNTILHKLKLNDENNNDFVEFFKGINLFFENESFQNMKSTNLKFKVKIYFIILTSSITTIFSIIQLFILSLSKLYYFILISLIILCILLLFCYFEQYKHMNLYLLYNELDYYLKSYNSISSYVEDYNTKIFSHINIRATVPVSFNYIMFNKEPEKVIEIKHFDMINFKRYFYPNVKEIRNNEILIKQFNELRANTTISGGINSFID